MSRHGRNQARRLLSRPALAGAAALYCMVVGSCVSMDTTSVEDRIEASGPGPRARLAATQPASAAATTPAASAPTALSGPFTATVEDAIFAALENNRSLAVERLNPQIRRTIEQVALAAFDPVVHGSVAYNRRRTNQVPTTQVTEGFDALAGVRTFLPTGTTLEATGSTGMIEGDFGQEDDWTSRGEISATQALLQGAGINVNLVSVRQARIDTKISQYELRGFAQDLVAQVEQTYWDCVLAQRQIEIVQNALDVARKQYEKVQGFVQAGKTAETELAAADAEIALRREELINANSSLETTRLKLWRLVNPRSVQLDDPRMQLLTLPVIPEFKLDDVNLHVRLAMQMRPDLNQAKLLIQRNELELVRTRNGLLPRLDLFITLGGTGYANSFGPSVRRIGGHNYDVLVGVSGDYPPFNREARALNQRATLNRDQSMLALDNLSQLAEVDVRGAYIELKRAQEQVRATAVTRRLQEVNLNAETGKFDVGISTSLLVAQAQRDLLSAQLAEVQAVVTCLKAMVELRRLEGSLLEFRSVTCPGAQPVDLSAQKADWGW